MELAMIGHIHPQEEKKVECHHLGVIEVMLIAIVPCMMERIKTKIVKDVTGRELREPKLASPPHQGQGTASVIKIEIASVKG